MSNNFRYFDIVLLLLFLFMNTFFLTCYSISFRLIEAELNKNDVVQNINSIRMRQQKKRGNSMRMKILMLKETHNCEQVRA